MKLLVWNEIYNITWKSKPFEYLEWFKLIILLTFSIDTFLLVFKTQSW